MNREISPQTPDAQEACARPHASSGIQTAGNLTKNAWRSFKCWYLPFMKSRYHSGQFRPLLSYLYTEYKCNVDCSYCYTWDNKVKGMTLEVAKKSIDWLHTTGCRVIAIMGGEPLLRKSFILDVIRYGSGKGFFVYLPTNGILLDKDFIDRAGRAGVAAINLALDTIDEIPGLPKSYRRIEPQFKYLLQMRKEYGYIVFLNINITTHNLDDVKRLTELAHENGIGTDYHINESPVIDYEHYRSADRGYWITREYYARVDETIDWLIEKNRSGYPMVNSAEHLAAMKDFIRHKGNKWKCRAGVNSLVIRIDGTLAPCFELYSSKDDWGDVHRGHRFFSRELARQKHDCNGRCLSTCNYQVAHYYETPYRGLQWVLKHIHRGLFKGPVTKGAGVSPAVRAH